MWGLCPNKRKKPLASLGRGAISASSAGLAVLDFAERHELEK
jgi:hypothetical protein